MTPQPRWRWVLFDLDGTLTDSAPGIMGGVSAALQELGHQVPPDRDLRAHIGPPLEWGFRELRGLDADSAVAARDAFRRYYAQTGWAQNAVYPGIRHLLEVLRDHGVHLAIATSKLEHMARTILEHFSLSGYFETICGAGAEESSANKAGIIMRALSELGGPPIQQAVMVGDRSHDIQAATGLGLDAIAVRWGYGDASEWDGALALASDPQQLAQLLLGAEALPRHGQ